MLTNLRETPCLFGALKSAERIHVSGTLLVLRAWESHGLSHLHPTPELDLPRHLLLNIGDGTTDQNDQ